MLSVWELNNTKVYSITVLKFYLPLTILLFSSEHAIISITALYILYC